MLLPVVTLEYIEQRAGSREREEYMWKMFLKNLSIKGKEDWTKSWEDYGHSRWDFFLKN